MTGTHFDVIIIGAGLSGVGAARHLQDKCPARTYAILEGREVIGGTWDLFRYPGVRSDSDMYTLGYAFRPWTEAKAIADGPSILNYIRETAAEGGVERHIRFGHTVTAASWSSAEALWTLEVVRSDGGLVHPQAWPQDLDYAGKRVVVIGSGATAVTLAPAMAETAAHVTMLQRTPTYVVSRPSVDAFADKMRARLPARLAYGLIRWRNVLVGMLFYTLARKRPAKTRERLLGFLREHLGPDYDIASHFTPPYDPWDQRLCLVPDADLFKALASGRAEVVTDHIDRFTATGLRLKSGRTLEADVVVAATGLRLQHLGGVAVEVDGAPVKFSQSMGYKGCMYSDVPNMASCFGYTNASWTLKCDLTCDYVCRLLNHMEARGLAFAVPRKRDPALTEAPMLSFTSGYVQRAIENFPKQGSKAPWKLRQNYALDLLDMKFSRLDDGSLEFHRATPARAAA